MFITSFLLTDFVSTFWHHICLDIGRYLGIVFYLVEHTVGTFVVLYWSVYCFFCVMLFSE